MADANQLEMALLNLVVNARDAMPEGGQITIDARERSARRRATTWRCRRRATSALSVTDTGEGMDDETLRARDRAVLHDQGRRQGHRPRPVHGARPGRAIGWALRAEEQAGRRHDGQLWLPAIPAAASGARMDAARRCRLAPSKPLAVLVVDDDALVLMNTAAMLDDEGHRVTMAYSGKEALKILRSGETFSRIELAFCEAASALATVSRIWAWVCGLPVTEWRSLAIEENVVAVCAMPCVVCRMFERSCGSEARLATWSAVRLRSRAEASSEATIASTWPLLRRTVESSCWLTSTRFALPWLSATWSELLSASIRVERRLNSALALAERVLAAGQQRLHLVEQQRLALLQHREHRVQPLHLALALVEQVLDRGGVGALRLLRDRLDLARQDGHRAPGPASADERRGRTLGTISSVRRR